MRRTSGALLVLAAAATSTAGPGDGDAAPPQVVADFEDPGAVERVIPDHGRAEIVEPGGSRALRWTPEGGAENSAIVLAVMEPPDLETLKAVRLRIRTEGARPGPLWLRVATGPAAYLEARVRGAGPEWRTLEFDLARMGKEGAFDPKSVVGLEFVVRRPAGGAYLLDDVAFFPGPAAGAALPVVPAKPGGKGNRRVALADFEAEESEDWADARRSTAARVPAGPKEKGSVLAWTLRAGDKVEWLSLCGLPSDVREFRTIRFRVRADRATSEALTVRLECEDDDDALSSRVEGIGTAWKKVEIRLPDMSVYGNFDPERVRTLSFIVFKPQDLVVHLDDIELEAVPGGWQLTEPEMMARIFSEERARKVKKIPTKHFDVFTDSGAAQSKFPVALEGIYDFVRRTLGNPEMEARLPVYIFQNSSLYFDFTVKFTGWSRAEAENTGGHGSGRYFATYYQAPEAPTIVHELTHSIFHRTVGSHGGSWLQEGVAVFVEDTHQKRSPAESFSPELRGGRFVGLKEFMAFKDLLSQEDAKGGPRTGTRLYQQAGAFYEFLVRGPPASVAAKAIPELARTPCRDEEQPALVAKLFGKSLEDLEKEWVSWGSDPPKAK